MNVHVSFLLPTLTFLCTLAIIYKCLNFNVCACSCAHIHFVVKKRVPLRLSVSKCQKQRWRQQTLGFFKCTVSKEEMELASGMKSQAENVSPEEDPPEVDSVKEVNSREELHPREEVDDVARSDLPEVDSLVEVDTVKSADKEVAVMELEHAQ